MKRRGKREKRREKSYPRCDVCHVESRRVKSRYHNGRDCVGKGAKYVGKYCPMHQPTSV